MLPALLGTLVFLGVGVMTIFWPRHIQRFAVRLYEKIGFWPYATLAEKMKRDFYIIELRIIGLVCLPVGVLCAWILWTGRTS